MSTYQDHFFNSSSFPNATRFLLIMRLKPQTNHSLNLNYLHNSNTNSILMAAKRSIQVLLRATKTLFEHEIMNWRSAFSIWIHDCTTIEILDLTTEIIEDLLFATIISSSVQTRIQNMYYLDLKTCVQFVVGDG